MGVVVYLENQKHTKALSTALYLRVTNYAVGVKRQSHPGGPARFRRTVPSVP